MENELIIRAMQHNWSFGVDIAIIRPANTPIQKTAIATNITMNTIQDGYDISPVCNIDKNAAQQLMDDLWQCGLRPTEGAGSAGSLAATKKHLDDMRKIVSKQLQVNL